MKSKAVPFQWKYDELRPLLLESGELLTAEEAERREGPEHEDEVEQAGAGVDEVVSLEREHEGGDDSWKIETMTV